jgi:Ca-activated chloride channel homolog
MMHVAWPWMAVLLPLPWLHLRWRAAAEPGGSAVYVPMAVQVAQGIAPQSCASRVGRWLFAIMWLLLVLAAARPQWLGPPQATPTSGRRILLAIDVSGSMATQDMADDASRLQVVQQVAGRFVDGRRGDQIGLILFGSRPYVQAPLTGDLATVHQLLDEAVVGIAGTQTAIGDAIGLALKRLSATARTATQAAQRTVLILLTDGQNDAGVMEPLQAARYAAQAGLRIYTIGVGAAARTGFFGISGNADLDEATLKAIAGASGGRYFRATDAGALRAVYREINALEPTAGHALWLRPATEWFWAPLLVALLLSIPAAMVRSRAWA